MTVSNPKLHVVLGAGQVGPLVARELGACGHDVRIVSRTQPRSTSGATWVQGDITDESFLREVTRGASVVYHTANPMRYDQWERLLPPMARSVQAALRGTDALLVLLDNLYMYGVPEGGIIHDASPMRPQSRKGELRAQLSNEFFEAQARGELRLSVARAADFFGPESARSMPFHPIFFKRLASGKAAPVLGDPDLPHAFAYIPDVAHALCLLGLRGEPSSLPWLLPTTWNGSTRALFELFSRISGRKTRPWRVPSWLWPVLGLWDGELNGIPEMLYQWSVPFKVDDTRFRREFGVSPTPVERAVAETLASYGFDPISAARAAA
jgi:nucleoside-diphosphate-sugar epimerase